VIDLNKTIQDLKKKVETVKTKKQKKKKQKKKNKKQKKKNNNNKKTQSDITLEIETLGKKSGTIDVSISKRIQEMEERN
jgi:hypothetical protein